MSIQQAVENLDFYCADYARRMVDTLKFEERVSLEDISHNLSRFLNILHVNGLYAYMLYILWKRYSGTFVERKIAARVDSMLVGEQGDPSLLRLETIGLPIAQARGSLDAGRELARDLRSLFLAKELIARTLTYARLQARTPA